MGKYDDICYPFMKEDSMYCDYEILSDGLCSYLGFAYHTARKEDYPEEIKETLLWLMEIVLHLNGSLRGKIAVTDDDLKKLRSQYSDYQKRGQQEGFTLPTGSFLSCQLHIARCEAKKVVRLLYKIEKDGSEVPAILITFSNILANLLYVLSLYINKIDKEEILPFTSKSYS